MQDEVYLNSKFFEFSQIFLKCVLPELMRFANLKQPPVHSEKYTKSLIPNLKLIHWNPASDLKHWLFISIYLNHRDTSFR